MISWRVYPSSSFWLTQINLLDQEKDMIGFNGLIQLSADNQQTL